MWSDGEFSVVGIFFCESRTYCFYVSKWLVHLGYLVHYFYTSLHVQGVNSPQDVQTCNVTQTPEDNVFALSLFFVDLKTKIIRFYEAKLGLVFAAKAFLLEFLSAGDCGPDWYSTSLTIKPSLENVTFMILKLAWLQLWWLYDCLTHVGYNSVINNNTDAIKAITQSSKHDHWRTLSTQ